MSTQVRLPGTISSPQAARLQLRSARALLADKRETMDSIHERVLTARDAAAAAAKELDKVERDLLASESRESDAAADKAHTQALKSWIKAEDALGEIKATTRLARLEYIHAGAALRAAREELEATRQGRRP